MLHEEPCSFNLKEIEGRLIRDPIAVVVMLCFGLEITNHTHDPVQSKGSVKEKKKKKIKEKFNP